MQLDDGVEDEDNYDDDASRGDDKDDEDLEGAGAPLDEGNADSHKKRLLCGVVGTYKEYGLCMFVHLPDRSADAPVTFTGVELQALTFFASGSAACAGEFFEEDLLICARCLG
jgi:hypothetical protein